MPPEKSTQTKNLLIITESDLADFFKIKAFAFYQESKKLQFFSFKHYLTLCLYAIENHFKEVYKEILTPSDDYLLFYQKRGKKSETHKMKESTRINFILKIEDVNLYYKLMHTYYINECPEKQSFSISRFFVFIVAFIENNEISFVE